MSTVTVNKVNTATGYSMMMNIVAVTGTDIGPGYVIVDDHLISTSLTIYFFIRRQSFVVTSK